MQMELRNFRPFSLTAVALMACAPALHGQVVGADAAPVAPLVASNDTPGNTLPNTSQIDFRTPSLAQLAGVTYTASSSSLDAVDADAAARLDFAGSESTQPPPRRRYGRPRYNDNSHNQDGSSKYGFLAGAGLTVPLGNTYKYLNTSYAFQVGAGRNFNKNFSLFLQFDWANFGFNGRTLATQSNYYFGTQGQGLDGTSHNWSFSINPTYNIYTREGLGAYVVVGVGFDHKTANFTVPVAGTYFDPYYGPQQYVANQTIDKYTSNAPGFNGGFGVTFKPSRFSNQRLYVEARYQFVDNQKRFGITPDNAANYLGNNYYPANSNRTTYLPITAGIRF